MASCKENGWVLDPFCGSSTTGVAATLLGRKYLGIDREDEFLNMSIRRREELNDESVRQTYRSKIGDIALVQKSDDCQIVSEPEFPYGDLPF